MQAAKTLSLDTQPYENLSIYPEADGEALFMSMDVRPRPCFTWHLIHDLLNFQKRFAATSSFGTTRLRCLVWASENPGIFSLGGDLALFQSAIASQDYKALTQYAEDCVLTL